MACLHTVAMPAPGTTLGIRSKAFKALLPVAVGVTLAVLPAPAGLTPNAWRYFALFAAVIVGLVTEPIPAAALGLLGSSPPARLVWLPLSPRRRSRGPSAAFRTRRSG